MEKIFFFSLKFCGKITSFNVYVSVELLIDLNKDNVIWIINFGILDQCTIVCTRGLVLV